MRRPRPTAPSPARAPTVRTTRRPPGRWCGSVAACPSPPPLRRRHSPAGPARRCRGGAQDAVQEQARARRSPARRPLRVRRQQGEGQRQRVRSGPGACPAPRAVGAGDGQPVAVPGARLRAPGAARSPVSRSRGSTRCRWKPGFAASQRCRTPPSAMSGAVQGAAGPPAPRRSAANWSAVSSSCSGRRITAASKPPSAAARCRRRTQAVVPRQHRQHQRAPAQAPAAARPRPAPARCGRSRGSPRKAWEP